MFYGWLRHGSVPTVQNTSLLRKRGDREEERLARRIYHSGEFIIGWQESKY